MGAVALPAVAALALVAALVVLTHPAALASYTANHTTAVLAAIGIAVASLGLVSSVTAELQASG